MNKQLFTLGELTGEVKRIAQQNLNQLMDVLVFGKDNLAAYFEAYGLTYYDDQTLEIRDIIDYCETKGTFPEWIEILKWLTGFSINLNYDVATHKIEWDFSEVTELNERGIVDLILFSRDCGESVLKFPVHETDMNFFQKHEQAIFNLLDDIKAEIDQVLAKIQFSLEMQYTETNYELEEGGALFDSNGTFVECVN